MTDTIKESVFIKPFVKWAGGKSSIKKVLNSQLPDDFGNQKNVTYIEPFVGSGAMLFYMLQTHTNDPFTTRRDKIKWLNDLISLRNSWTSTKPKALKREQVEKLKYILQSLSPAQ